MSRQSLVAQAQSWLGCKEADGSFRKIIDTYNTINPLPRSYRVQYTDAWCAAFVSACSQATGQTSIVLPECSCPVMISSYQAIGRWQENDAYTPQPGDIIMYDWDDTGAGDNTGTADHVGIVESVNGTTMSIIEGNISNMVGRRTLQVNARYIRGYCLPNYEGETSVVYTAPSTAKETSSAGTYTVQSGDSLWGISEKTLGDGSRYREIMQANGLTSNLIHAGQTLKIPSGTETVVSKTETTDETCSVTLPVLVEGSTGNSVTALQLILNNRLKTSLEIDGEIGPNTLAAIKSFQKSKGLDADGSCGPSTWTALLK